MNGAHVVDRARRFAALSGPFDPLDAMHSLGDLDPDQARDAALELASVCETSHPTRWLMWGWARRRELDRLASAGDVESAVAEMRARGLDGADADVIDAVTGSGPYGLDAVWSAAEAPTPDRDELVRLSMALDRAGAHAPAFDALPAVRAALARLDADARVDWVDDRGVFGRDAEIAQVLRWIADPRFGAPVTAFTVTGPAGIGKTTLLDEVVRRAGTEWSGVVVRLDFDRAGLDVLDRVGLVGDIARQVVRQVGEVADGLERVRLRVAGSGSRRGAGLKGAGRDRLPVELAVALGETVRAAGVPVLLTLDALEVLPRRGETHIRRLFETLDALSEAGFGPLAVLAAGSDGAFDRVGDRAGAALALEGIDDASADALLGSLGVPPDQLAAVRRAAGGSPTLLRLGATAVRDFGRAAVEGMGDGPASLFHFLLGRIDADSRRALAQPGLLARRVSVALLADILGREIGLPDPDAAARDAFAALAAQEWLVEPDVADGWLRLRPEVRSMLLDDVYRDMGRIAAGRVNRAIAAWYATRSEPFAALEAGYHRLQAMRAGSPAPLLAGEVLTGIDDAMLDELDDHARDAVRRARGDRTSQYRHTERLRTPTDAAAAARELEAALERGDLVEAAHIHRRSFAMRGITVPDEADAVSRTFEWRAGRWSAALAGARPDRLLADRERSVSPLVARAHLEMWAETRFAGLVRALRRDGEIAALDADLADRGFAHALVGGALDLARLRSTSGTRSTPVLGAPRRRPGVVDAAAAVWASDDPWPADEVPPVVRDALAGLEAADLHTPSGAALALAAESPYASVAETVLRLAGRTDRLRQHLLSVSDRLAQAGRVSRPGTAGSSTAALDAVIDAGLFAEWISSAASRLRRPDLRVLARSAERWRRTMAGDWAYPTVPDVPTGWSRHPDPVLVDRAAQLTSIDACEAEIGLWADDDTPQLPVVTLARRHRAAVREAAGRSVSDAITVLQARQVPSAFIPPLAVLCHYEGMPS